MSAQGATLERRGIHVPIWSVFALLVVAAVTAIGVNVIGDVRQAEPVSTVQEAELSWQSTVGHPASPRQGARLTMVELIGVAGIEGSAAAVRELPAVPFHTEGRAHEVNLGPATATVGVPSESPLGDCQHCKQRR